MKKVMASLLTIGVFLSVAVAQTPAAKPAVAHQARGHEQKMMKHKTPDEWINELDAVVKLSAEQKEQAKKLAVETESKMKALREEAKKGADKEQIHQKRMQIQKERRAALDKILNDEQKAKWKAHRKEMKAKQAAFHKPRTADEQVNSLDAIVGLTAEQKVKVKALVEAKDAKVKALREEQKATPNEEAYKQKRMAAHKEYKAELDKILTDEQKAKLKAHREAIKEQKGSPRR